jgi:hypothetical protein
MPVSSASTCWYITVTEQHCGKADMEPAAYLPGDSAVRCAHGSDLLRRAPPAACRGVRGRRRVSDLIAALAPSPRRRSYPRGG